MRRGHAIGNVAVKVKDRHADNTGTDDDVLVAASSTNTGHLNIIFCKHSARGLIEIPNENIVNFLHKLAATVAASLTHRNIATSRQCNRFEAQGSCVIAQN